MKRFLCSFMLLSFLLSQGIFVAAADSAKSTTMRLERIVGTLSIVNQNKKSVKVSEGMKLLSGYTITSKANSYAYISLDDNKAIKLDGLSSATVKKKGKKLEISLASGNLYFNVKVPLAADETLDIRTSTMVTGIRGTIGIASVKADGKTDLTLLSGSVSFTGRNPLTGELSDFTLKPGETASFRAPTVATQDAPEVVIRPAKEESIPPFVGQELKDDPSALEIVGAQSGLDTGKVLESLDLSIKEEAAKQNKLESEADTAAKESIDTSTTKDVFPDVPSFGGGGGGSSPSAPSSATTLTNPSEGDLSSALAAYDTVNLSGSTSLAANFTIPTGKTLKLLSGATLTSPTAGVPLNVEGTLLVDTDATLVNSTGGNIVVSSTSSLTIAGMFTNGGQLQIGLADGTPGKLTLQSTAQFTNGKSIMIFAGSMHMDAGASFTSTSGNITLLPAALIYSASAPSGITNPNIFHLDYQGGGLNTKVHAISLGTVFDDLPANSTLSLTENVALPSGEVITLAKDKTLTIQLDTHKITFGATSGSNASLQNFGTLTLNGAGANAHLVGTLASPLIQNHGSLHFSGIKASNNGSVSGDGSGGVVQQTIDANGSSAPHLSIDAGTVLENTAATSVGFGTVTLSAGTMDMIAGQVTAGTTVSTNATAVLLGSGASFTMQGGTVENFNTGGATVFFAVQNPTGSVFDYRGGNVLSRSATTVCEIVPTGYAATDTTSSGVFSLTPSP